MSRSMCALGCGLLALVALVASPSSVWAGSIIAWGQYGYSTAPEPNSGFVAVATGYAHNLGLKADGSIVAWGYNYDGQCNVPAPNSRFVAIAAGAMHSLGLKADGSVVAWGRNDCGQCNVPLPNSGFTAMAAGWNHSLGLKADGSIVAWGPANSSKCEVPAPNSGFTAVAAGSNHSLGLRSNGSIAAWGDNYTEVCFPETGCSTVYVGQCDVPAPNSDFVAIAASDFGSLGLKAAGYVVAWGHDECGQPNTVPSPNTGFTAIAAGGMNLGIAAEGMVVAWGCVDWPFLGPNGDFIAVAAGRMYCLALKLERPFVYAFDINNGASETSDHTVTLDNTCSNSPTEYMASESSAFTGAVWQPYSTSPTFVLSPGSGTKTVCLKTRNADGVSGVHFDTITAAFQPAVTSFAINGGASTTSLLTVTLNNTCSDLPTEYRASEASDFTGAVWQTYSATPSFVLSAGYGTRTVYFQVRSAGGQSPAVSDTIMLSETVAPVPNRFVINNDAARASMRLVALHSDCLNQPTECMASESADFAGAAWRPYAVGVPFSLSIGNGTKTVYFKARNIAGETPVVSDAIILAEPTPAWIVAWGNASGPRWPNGGFSAVSFSEDHALALKADGSVAAWGSSTYGQCAVPSPNTAFAAVAAGYLHSLGLKADGSVVAWGRNNEGQCSVPLPSTGFVAIAAGYSHSLGLKADGSVVAWGRNNEGQCSVPLPSTGFVAVAAGFYHSLGLKADGSIVAWGANPYGECTVPSPNTGFVAVTAGSHHSLGLRTDGSIVAWGGNDSGQCSVPSPNTGFVAAAAGSGHSLGLRADGSVVAWGYNNFGQCRVPPPNSGFLAIGAGGFGSLALSPVAPIKSGGDFNHDGDVDLDDFNHFQSCFTGPNHVPTWANCADVDFDDDADVDLEDFAVFRNCFNGPNRAPACAR